MALRVIKQTFDELLEVYYEHILKLTNYLHHKANNNTTFFRVGLVPYLWVATIGMRRNNLFLHKKVAMTCEEGMGDVNEYRKLLEPPPKSEKIVDSNGLVCNQCKNSSHTKDVAIGTQKTQTTS